ncbi:hypothetical protein BO86DRAFT_139803 [Aspergillus japonicus CBS 114.51]|uniref:Uncharacterized protein n=1 Tax=Aspergillus japonicus CBS 114.51 TaxID=1448312 RepID=A0A8T8XFM0_ASPJA|nr:hypothetical protein BO86DRAFT_139803 [Aspergillus japonicus CBS 114.51]RAH86139.1 hypothetical protein BO86DRAFT_139803 [Aspergillus japonicus CBS 114.51]
MSLTKASRIKRDWSILHILRCHEGVVGLHLWFVGSSLCARPASSGFPANLETSQGNGSFEAEVVWLLSLSSFKRLSDKGVYLHVTACGFVA